MFASFLVADAVRSPTGARASVLRVPSRLSASGLRVLLLRYVCRILVFRRRCWHHTALEFEVGAALEFGFARGFVLVLESELGLVLEWVFARIGVSVEIATPLSRVLLVSEAQGTANRAWDWKWKGIGEARHGSVRDGVVR